MRRQLYIPTQVKESIKKHFHDSILRATAGYLSANEDEDTLTGHLGALLSIGSQKVQVTDNEVPGIWTWSINYYKFRGRGKKATENIVGADGIFELIIDYGNNQSSKKSLLFQAKNNWASDSLLYSQCIKLSTWREAAFVLNYSPDEFQAFSIDDAIKSRGVKLQAKNKYSLHAFMGETFLDCKVGDTELDYDATKRTLVWRAYNDELVAASFSIGNRFTLKINPPKRKPSDYRNITKHLRHDEIYNYRMKADEEDILALNSNYTGKDIKKARRIMALSYHTDVNHGLDSELKRILTQRSQEINKAYEYVYARRKKS